MGHPESHDWQRERRHLTFGTKAVIFGQHTIFERKRDQPRSTRC
jgi:hypothetical protein